jgi:predicted Zn-dependent peptidase
MRPARFVLFGLLIPLALSLGVHSAAFSQFEALKKRVKEHTLSNGMKFIVLERHDAPVVSFLIYADVGSANESYGITGISHFLEHMAFKGTKIVGTKDHENEQSLLDRIDQLYERLVGAQTAVIPDSEAVRKLQAQFDQANKEAQDLIVVNEYDNIFSEQGALGLNASTDAEATRYTASLPSNKLELWMAMESDRFMNPVFRQFFEERDVVMEERRLSVETQPYGQLYEDFTATAFKAHPYGHPVFGYMSDLQRITRKDVQDYFRRYYNPSNLTAAIVGDVKADEVFTMAELYFGRIPSGPKPEPLRTVEPAQAGERRVTVVAESQPILLVGYHQPKSPEDLPLHALSSILGRGRSSRLYKSLVTEKQIAVEVSTTTGWPGGKYPSLFVVTAVPAKGHTTAECLAAIGNEIKRAQTELVSEEELTKHKRRVMKAITDRTKWNGASAHALTWFEVVQGDWRKAFDVIHDIEAVTPADIQRDARKYLVPTNRTIGELLPKGP